MNILRIGLDTLTAQTVRMLGDSYAESGHKDFWF